MLNNQKHVRRVMVDYDMLFDLRIALFEKLNPDLGVKLLHEKTYFKRDTDRVLRDALAISREAWFGQLKGDGLYLMRNSITTALCYNIVPYLNDHLDMQVPGQSFTRTLTINFPYEERLTDDEWDELHGILSNLYYGFFQEIYRTHYTHAQLGMDKLASQYTDYFCYHWHSWMEAQYPYIEGNFKPTFKMWYARLLADQDIDKDLDKETQKQLEQTDLFDLVYASHIPAFEIRWIDVEDVCFALPKDR